MGKAYFKWINGSFHPVNLDQLAKLTKKLVNNQVVELQVNHSRSFKALAYYWTILKHLSDAHGQTTDQWHLYFKMKFLPLEEFTNALTGEKMLYISSVAFDRMTEDQFKDYLNNVLIFLGENGVEIYE